MAHARKQRGFGWERWSRPWLYDTLKLFNSNRCGGITYKFCARVEMMSSVAD
jgi:hypothetical protein